MNITKAEVEEEKRRRFPERYDKPLPSVSIPEQKDKKLNITTKNIREFTQKDTIYVRKSMAGFIYYYLCKFKKFEKGIVTAEVIEKDGMDRDKTIREKGNEMSIRLDGCYLKGKLNEGDRDDHHHHFYKDGVIR